MTIRECQLVLLRKIQHERDPYLSQSEAKHLRQEPDMEIARLGHFKRPQMTSEAWKVISNEKVAQRAKERKRRASGRQASDGQ